ncbi:nitroreductase family deazaflavin-dependent oxidoreductase [Streptomyces sp. WZ-12]|uniref:nitroreductase family deazaflavin-dependent oxidoreductase n=1 Tax=Streptomyces sp. WZ-12 TaxID=3030210 RepID=UPI0023818033|nr:nitroreductase family deazaflavin-dependent oxidoreductase [Streptomyces sp. WZ-12]
MDKNHGTYTEEPHGKGAGWKPHDTEQSSHETGRQSHGTRRGPHGNSLASGDNEVNRRVIAEFRANGGAVGGPFAGRPLLLLTTRGARTGRPRTTPVCHLTDGPGRLAVFASNGGATTPPAWYRNLIAHPEVTVEVGTRIYRARATEATGADRARLWERQVAADPQFATFRERAGRPVPVVVLTPLDELSLDEPPSTTPRVDDAPA